jgi:hypothetical protein
VRDWRWEKLGGGAGSGEKEFGGRASGGMSEVREMTAGGEELDGDDGPIDSTSRPPLRPVMGRSSRKGRSGGEELEGRPARAWVTPEELREGTNKDELGGRPLWVWVMAGRISGRRSARCRSHAAAVPQRWPKEVERLGAVVSTARTTAARATGGGAGAGNKSSPNTRATFSSGGPRCGIWRCGRPYCASPGEGSAEEVFPGRRWEELKKEVGEGDGEMMTCVTIVSVCWEGKFGECK